MVFSTTTFHCSDWSWPFPKLPDCLIYTEHVSHVCSVYAKHVRHSIFPCSIPPDTDCSFSTRHSSLVTSAALVLTHAAGRLVRVVSGGVGGRRGSALMMRRGSHGDRGCRGPGYARTWAEDVQTRLGHRQQQALLLLLQPAVKGCVKKTEHHLPHGITKPLNQVNAPHLKPSQTDRYSIYLPQTCKNKTLTELILNWCWLDTEMVYLSTDNHLSKWQWPDRKPNPWLSIVSLTSYHFAIKSSPLCTMNVHSLLSWHKATERNRNASSTPTIQVQQNSSSGQRIKKERSANNRS